MVFRSNFVLKNVYVSNCVLKEHGGSACRFRELLENRLLFLLLLVLRLLLLLFSSSVLHNREEFEAFVGGEGIVKRYSAAKP